MSREYTTEEVRDKFLDYIMSLINYWEKQHPSCRDNLDGLTHSILVALDGGATELPSFTVAPAPHPDDKEYNKDQGKNYYSENTDIAGNLHDCYNLKRKKIKASNEKI